MRWLVICWSIAVISGCPTSGDKRESVDLPQVAILGTFHFGATSDFSSMDLDDFMAERRQVEISDLVDKLKSYNPTKIMVEYPHTDRSLLDSTYQLYRVDQFELPINEIYQLGYRLAHQMGHDHIYSVDYTMELPFGPLTAFAEEHMAKEFESFLVGIKEGDRRDSELLRENSLVDYFIYKNSDDEDYNNKSRYLSETAQFVSESTSVGVDFVARWWHRNLHIMSLIDRQMDSDDRVLVIIGGAHRAVLRSFYEDRVDVEYVEIGEYLR